MVKQTEGKKRLLVFLSSSSQLTDISSALPSERVRTAEHEIQEVYIYSAGVRAELPPTISLSTYIGRFAVPLVRRLPLLLNVCRGMCA